MRTNRTWVPCHNMAVPGKLVAKRVPDKMEGEQEA